MLTIVTNMKLVELDVDAIVCPTDEDLEVRGGVREEILSAAGMDLVLNALESGDDLVAGDVMLTKGFGLKAKHILHAVYFGEDDEQLAKCYSLCMVMASGLGYESLAIPLLGVGKHGFAEGYSMMIAVEVITEFLKNNHMEVYLVL